MTDNEIGPIGASYIAEMLSDNRIITDLVSLLLSKMDKKNFDLDFFPKTRFAMFRVYRSH